MLKAPYDTDCVTWSPQGRLFQIDYAMEAIKQGSLCVALRSNQWAVLAALNRRPDTLADYQQKTYKIDDKIGLCFSGLTADGRLICKFLRTEALNYKYTYTQPINPQRLVNMLAQKAQIKTQRYGKRPYGVGCLMAGVDVNFSQENGPHIYEINPDANYDEYYAIAIGVRNQSAKTYLERNFQGFGDCNLYVVSKEEMVRHAIEAVKASAYAETELNGRSVTVATVGRNEEFKFLEPEETESILERLNQGMDLDQQVR